MVRGIANSKIGFGDLILLLRYFFKLKVSTHPILSAANISISSAPVEHMLIPNFKDGFLLQWLNPKAWLACVSGITMFTSIENPQSLPIFIIIYFFTCYACLFFWGFCGDKFSVVLNQGNRLKYFNILMGAFLILSALLILIDFF
ncbi:LysE family translocator, partial [Acinetobacter baumannii]